MVAARCVADIYAELYKDRLATTGTGPRSRAICGVACLTQRISIKWRYSTSEGSLLIFDLTVMDLIAAITDSEERDRDLRLSEAMLGWTRGNGGLRICEHQFFAWRRSADRQDRFVPRRRHDSASVAKSSGSYIVWTSSFTAAMLSWREALAQAECEIQKTQRRRGGIAGLNREAADHAHCGSAARKTAGATFHIEAAAPGKHPTGRLEGRPGIKRSLTAGAGFLIAQAELV
jgi:hypothetical protein